MNHPSIAGTSGKSTTLLVVAVITGLWLAATGRVARVVSAFNGKVPSPTPTNAKRDGYGLQPGVDPGFGLQFPHRNADGSWTIPDFNVPHGIIGSGH